MKLDTLITKATNQPQTNVQDKRTHTLSNKYFLIPRFTEDGERIYKLSVNDIAAYCGINRQNINYYLCTNPEKFYKVERLGEHDSQILGVKNDHKRLWIVYATKKQLNELKI